MDVKAVMLDINKELSLCQLQLRGVVLQGTEVYGIVNTVSSLFTVPALLYFCVGAESDS